MKIPFLNLEIVRNASKSVNPRGVSAKDGEVLFSYMQYEGVRIAPKDLWKVYRMNADVYSCIREWKQSVGAGGYQFKDTRDNEIDAPAQEAAMLEQFFVNSGGFDKFKNNVVRDIGISGNAFFEIVKSQAGKPYGLKRLDPRTMAIVADKHGTVLKYMQKVSGNETITFEPDEMLHVVMDDDPDNELLGMSPLETALWEARTDISAAQSNYYFFENDAVPSTVYVLDERIPKSEQEATFDKIKAQFSGAENKHKSAVLSGVKEIKTIAMSHRDMEFVLGRKFNTEKVCSVYGVPKYMLGYTEGVNYANGLNMRADFYSGTIVPIEQMIEDTINRNLLPKLGIERTVLLFNPQNFGEQMEGNRFALSEFQLGALTLRQYKVKTGQVIMPEDEDDPMIDKHIIHNGGGAVLLEDVGVDPIVDPDDPEMAENMVKALKNKFTNETD